MRGVPGLLTRLLFAAGLFAFDSAGAQSLPSGFRDSVLVSDFDVPIAIAFAPGRRALVAEQISGIVRIVHLDDPSRHDTLLTVPSIDSGGEEGLLGLALDPGFPARPYLYTHQTSVGQVITISRWTLSGDLAGTGTGQMTADPASRFDLIGDAPNLATNHNGGTVGFGSDGMLYVSLGDDASGCPAQDTTTLVGKILRLDVSRLPAGPGAALRSQIAPADNPFASSPDSNAWVVDANGLRNPFRFQVDASRGWLVIADVGESRFEEIDLLSSGGTGAGVAPAGANFGWPWLEGNAAYTTCSNTPPPFSAPIYAYDRSGFPGAATISAGSYHRQPAGALDWPLEYEGDILFSEYYTGYVWRLELQSGVWSVAPAVAGQPDSGHWASGYDAVTDWRESSDGGLFYCRQYTGNYRNSGTLGMILPSEVVSVPPAVPGPVLLVSPNPGFDAIGLSWKLASARTVSLEVYDARGRRVRTLVPYAAEAVGSYSQPWDGRDDHGRKLPPGLYWARLIAGADASSARMVLLR